MTDLIQRNRIMYSDANPYVPDTFRPRFAHNDHRHDCRMLR